ncbi:MAG: hypothetical protein MUD06_05035 [Rhodospirillales bacterium]|nr:hypothetical protein [Rhodospirillales bacterium]
MNQHLLNNHAFLVTKDLDHSREVLSSAWEHHEISVHKGWEYSVRWHQASLKRVSLSYTDSPTSLHVASSPVANTYHFGIHLSGYSSHKMNGYEALLSPDIAGLQAPGQELKFDTQPFRALLLNLDGDFVEPALRRRLGRVPPFEEWAREFAIGPGPSACLKSLCQWTAYELDQPDSWLLKSQRTAGGLEKGRGEPAGQARRGVARCALRRRGVHRRPGRGRRRERPLAAGGLPPGSRAHSHAGAARAPAPGRARSAARA